MKIRYKLLGILAALFFLSIVTVTLYQYWRESYQHLSAEKSSWLKVGLGMVRTWNTTMLFTGSDNLARDQLFNQKRGDELLSIELKRNEKLTRINPESSPYVSTELEKRVIAKGKSAFKILVKNGHGGRRLQTVVPIKAQPACVSCHQKENNHRIKEGEVMAVISLISSLKAVDAQIASDRAATIFSLLGIFFVTLVISYLTLNRFTRPITNLTQASEAMAAGNLEVQVPTATKDELGILGNAFNLMVQRVKESRDALEAYSRELEEQVEERTRELKLTALFAELNPGPVLRIDSNGIILQCNPAAEQVFKDKKLVGKNWQKVCPQIKQEMLSASHSTSEEGIYQSEVSINGKVYQFTFKRFTDYDAVHVYGADITERKRAEEKLAEYRNHLEELVRERTQKLEAVQKELLRKERLATIGQVAGSIAHELRNPLGAIRNAVFYLKRKVPESEPKWREYFGIMDQEVRAADQTISNLLDLSRPRELKKEAVDLGHLLQEVFNRANVPEEVRWQFELSPDPFILEGDPTRLKQVFDNLLSNALQAIDGNGEIVVTALHSPEGDSITFQDDGPGIAVEHRTSVFEPLYSTKARGFGLGLWICRQIVELHWGTISLESDKGQGTTFKIQLPR